MIRFYLLIAITIFLHNSSTLLFSAQASKAVQKSPLGSLSKHSTTASNGLVGPRALIMLMQNLKDAESISSQIATLTEVTEQLIAEKADVNATDNLGYSPLHWAVTYSKDDNSQLLQCLLQRGAMLTTKDHVLRTPIDLACAQGKIRLLFSAEYVSRTAPDKTVTPSVLVGPSALVILMKKLASRVGVDLESTALPSIVELLLRYKADVNAQDRAGYSPLHWAVKYDTTSSELFACLLENRADTQLLDKMRRTPIDLACALGRTKALDCLFSAVESKVETKDWE